MLKLWRSEYCRILTVCDEKSGNLKFVCLVTAIVFIWPPNKMNWSKCYLNLVCELSSHTFESLWMKFKLISVYWVREKVFKVMK